MCFLQIQQTYNNPPTDPPSHNLHPPTCKQTGDLKKPSVKADGILFGLIGGGEVNTGPDKYQGLSQEAMAKALWSDAKDALNDYFTLANKILGLELRQFELI